MSEELANQVSGMTLAVPPNSLTLGGPREKPKKRFPVVCYGSTRPITDIRFTQRIESEGDAYYLICSSKDNSVMLRDGRCGDWVGSFQGHKGAVWSAVLDSKASLCLSAAADFSAKLWDAYQGTLLGTIQHRHVVRSAAFGGSNEETLYLGGMDGALRSWDMRSWQQIGEHKHEQAIKNMVWTESGTGIVTVGDAPKFCVFDPRTCQTEREVKVGESGKVRQVILSTDRKVLIVTHSNQVSLFDAHTLQPYSENPTFKSSMDLACAAYHAPTKHLVVAGVNSLDSQLIDLNTSETQFSGKGHTGPIHGIGFSPDGKLFGTGSEDGTIRLWPTMLEEHGFWTARSIPAGTQGARGSPIHPPHRRTPSPSPLAQSPLNRSRTPQSQKQAYKPPGRQISNGTEKTNWRKIT